MLTGPHRTHVKYQELSISHILTQLLLARTLMSKYNYFPHFVEEIKAQRI